MRDTRKTHASSVLSAAKDAITKQMNSELKEIGKSTIRGKEPHPILVIRADRSRYIANSLSNVMETLSLAMDAYRDLRDLDLIGRGGSLSDARLNDLSKRFSGVGDPRAAATLILMERMSQLAD